MLLLRVGPAGTTDKTENRKYWKIMMKTGHKDVEMVSKGEKGEKLHVQLINTCFVLNLYYNSP